MLTNKLPDRVAKSGVRGDNGVFIWWGGWEAWGGEVTATKAITIRLNYL